MQPPGLNIYTSQSRTDNARTCRIQGRYSGAEAVLVAVPDGSVAYVPGAVTGTTVPVCYMASSFLPSAGYGARAAALSRAR